MRSILRLIVLAPVLCTTAAFAAEKVSVNVPFSFESHGKSFPAGRYDVRLDDSLHVLTLNNREQPGKGLAWGASQTVAGANAPALTLKFDVVDNTHELRTIRLENYETAVLNAHKKHSLEREVSYAKVGQ
jgi:hypothetical protein